MTKKSAREWLGTIVIGIFSLFLVAGLIAALECHGLASSEAAGWIQAIGSVGAIVVAIWVMNAQHRAQERTRKREETLREFRILSSIRSEVEVLSEAFLKAAGPHLAGAVKGQPLIFSWRFVPDQFVVFDNLVPRIDAIEKDAFRKLLIQSYASFRGLIFAIELNSSVIDEIQAEAAKYTEANPLTDAQNQTNRLRLSHVADQVIDRYQAAIQAVEDIKRDLAEDVLRAHFNLPRT